MPAQTFSVHNILGKSPNDPRIEDVYDVDKNAKPLGKGAFGVVRLGVRKSDAKQFAVKSIVKTKLVCKEDVQDVRSEVAIMNLVAGNSNVVSLTVSPWHRLALPCSILPMGRAWDALMIGACHLNEARSRQSFDLWHASAVIHAGMLQVTAAAA
jgi:hypothetical protein